MASSSSFIPSKRTQGRKAGVAGEKSGTHEFNLVRKKAPFFQKYCQKVTFEGERGSAAYAANRQPQVFLNPVSWAEQLTFESCELVNRPATGVPELCPCIEAFVISTKESEFLSNGWKLKVDGWAGTFEILESRQQLNAKDYPAHPRSAQSLEKATTNLLKGLQVIRAEWSKWQDLVARSSVHIVAGSWLLSAASPATPGTWAQKIQDIPVKAAEEKRTFLCTPQSGTALKNFPVAEIQADHGLKEKVPMVPLRSFRWLSTPTRKRKRSQHPKRKTNPRDFEN